MRKITDEELARARAFIAARRWKFASTYAKTAPHEYTVRYWDPDVAEYFWFARLILECGYRQNYYKRINRYLEIDGWKYFGLPDGYDNRIEESEVINRATLTAFQPPGSTAGRFKEDGG